MPRNSSSGIGKPKASARTGAGCLRLFFVPFALVGLVTFYYITVRSIANVIAAKSWEPAPAQVVSSEVKAASGKGTTYSIVINYAYHFRGRKYTSARYDFSVGSTSGRQSKQAVVDRFPPGAQITCYVNPADPHEAVIERGFTKGLWFILFPLPFLAIGVLGFIFAPRLQAASSSSREGPIKTTSAKVTQQRGIERPIGAGGGSTPLRPTLSRGARVFGMTAFAVIWNGIVSFFVYHVYEGFQKGKPEWFLTIFMIPFVLIGLGSIGGIFYQLLNLLNPQIAVTLDRGGVCLGESVSVDWKFTGATSRIRRLAIFIEGVEKATYRRGTDTVTDVHVFAKIPVLDTIDPAEIPVGSVKIEVPAGLMHTFKGRSNEVVWALKAKGEVPMFPDVAEEFEVPVFPKSSKAV